MDDGISLSNLMAEVGFGDVSIKQPDATMIADATGLNFIERSDQSVYVEEKNKCDGIGEL
jgi:hypothetical protein